jgi:hypothetical protein
VEKLRAANRGGDVHLIGGPRTIETFSALGALDKLELVVLPLLLGDGMRLTPPLGPGIATPEADLSCPEDAGDHDARDTGDDSPTTRPSHPAKISWAKPVMCCSFSATCSSRRGRASDPGSASRLCA